MNLTIELPIAVYSEANLRGSWRAHAARVQQQRGQTRMLVLAKLREERPDPSILPRRIVLTRIASRLMDDDNLAGAFKAIRDGVADAMGIDDSHRSGIFWAYSQEQCGRDKNAARVELQWNPDGCPRCGYKEPEVAI